MNRSGEVSVLMALLRGYASHAEVIATGDDCRHDLLSTLPSLTLLAAEAGAAARPAVGLKRFLDPLPKTGTADLYVLYTDGGEFPLDQQDALATLVAEGKSLLAIHSSVAAGGAHDEDEARQSPFQRLIGAWAPPFANELAIGTEVRVRIAEDPLPDDLEDFDVKDGLTPFAFLDDAHRVLAEVDAGGESRAVAYAREYGNGRVGYIALGHDSRSVVAEPFRRLAIATTKWLLSTP